MSETTTTAVTFELFVQERGGGTQFEGSWSADVATIGGRLCLNSLYAAMKQRPGDLGQGVTARIVARIGMLEIGRIDALYREVRFSLDATQPVWLLRQRSERKLAAIAERVAGLGSLEGVGA